jgi:transcriptional regulator of acetoin/glycerol metabolism
VTGTSGAMQGVLNVTTARQGDERTNRVVQNIVGRSARRIEARHFGRVYRRSVLLRISEDAESADLAEDGRLALDDAGRVIAGTSQAASLIGSSLDEIVGSLADEVFDLSVPLGDARPERPFRLTFNGKPMQGVLSFPDARPLQSTAYHSDRRLAVVAAHSVPVGSTPPQEQLRIDPITAIAIEKAQKLFDAGLPLIVTGESGTGKTSFAQTVARRSVGPAGNLILVDCALLSTASSATAIFQNGVMQSAGCLILDRFDELSDSGQNALLALLDRDRNDAHRIGIVAVAESDLDQISKAHKLRPSLFHRLKGGSITLPPLRNDPNLDGTIQDFLKIELTNLDKHGLKLDEDARLVLRHYHWPGNHRELRNTLRHAVVLADRKAIRLEHLPVNIVSEIARKDLTARSQSEAARIEAALRHNGGNLSLTARYLGVSRATLYRKIHIQKVREEV